jgi:glycosyltransferase involved in cell wall biosynthesis
VPMPEELAWNSVNQVRVLVDSLQVDLLHAHLPNAHLLAGVAGRLAGRPVLATVHGRQLSLTDLEVHRAVASHLSVVCRYTYFHALGLGVAPNQLSCEPNGVDTQVFAPRRSRGTLRRRLKLPPSAPLVGFVGRLSMEKGPEVLVRAAFLLRQAKPDAHVIFVGEGPCRATVQALIEKMGLNSCIHLLGLHEDMPSLYGELDVLVSTSYSEAMPLAIMEAMACGLPVVATRVGGVPDMVQHGRTGWLVAPGDFEDIARCLALLLSDEEARSGMGAAARRHALSQWQLEACVTRLGRLIERLSGTHTDLHDLHNRSSSASLDQTPAASAHHAQQTGATLN